MRISLETISKKGRSFISTARDKIPTRLRGTKNKEEHKNNVPKGNQILPLNFDTPETPIEKPDILKKIIFKNQKIDWDVQNSHSKQQ